MDLFPIIQTEESEELAFPMFRDVKWDFEKNRPVIENGNPVWVEGKEAVLSWAYRALATVRGKFPCFSADYGCEIDTLIGQGYSKELQTSECNRFIEECLLINPYIAAIEDIEVNIENDLFKINAKIITFYGEVKINV